MDSLPETDLILNLAKARALLIHEAQSHMPKGAAAQRADVVATLEQLIAQGHTAIVRLSPSSAQNDPISAAARQYVQQPMPKPEPITQDAADSAYSKLQRLFTQMSHLRQAGEVIGWIESTHATTMPELNKTVLSEAKAAVDVSMHRLIANPQVRGWLEAAEAQRAQLDATDQRNLVLMQQEWLEAAGLSEAHVDALSRAVSESNTAWEAARPANDFAHWLPHFERVVALMRQQGEMIGAAQGVSAYQALLGSISFNPGLRNETVNRIFDELRAALPEFIQQVSAQQAAASPPLPLPPVPVDAQERIGRRIMKQLGLEDAYARLDVTAHPFSSGQWDDVRIATRYNPDNMMPALMGIIHETGHALYSRAQPRGWKDQPIGNAQSMWVHESQSLFWENQVAKSRAFMEYLAGVFAEELGVAGPEWSAENLHRLVTRVKPGLIRVDADEVTYPAHIVLRHTLEQRLIDGSLAPKDVPAAWNAAMQELLGVTVPDDAHGCLQDVHWPVGYLGYFPAYTFGAIGAAQLMEKAKQDMPDTDAQIRAGNFGPLRAWLGTHVHRQGSRYSGEELMERATGKPLSTNAFFSHLRQRYLDSQ